MAHSRLLYLLPLICISPFGVAAFSTRHELDSKPASQQGEVIPLYPKQQGRRDQPVLAVRSEANRKYGFINRFNEMIIEPQFDWAEDFEHGLAVVKQDETLSIIDEKGKTKCKLPAGVDEVQVGTDGMIWFNNSRKTKWGLMNSEGKVIVEPKYDEVMPFADGMAAVNLGATWARGFQSGGKWGFINKSGELIIPIRYMLVSSFSEGVAHVMDDNASSFVDHTGKVILKNTDSAPSDFHEGLSAFTGGFDDKNRETKYLDRLGKTIFKIKGSGEGFHEGMARFTQAANNQSGFINKQGKVVIEARYNRAYDFSDGLAAVSNNWDSSKKDEYSWGFIDKTGMLRIKPVYNEVHSFTDELTRVHLGGKFHQLMDAPSYWSGGEWWIIDITGKQLRRCYEREQSK